MSFLVCFDGRRAANVIASRHVRSRKLESSRVSRVETPTTLGVVEEGLVSS
jgi:hypothetical protein